jgi:hypothetical protein
VFLLAGVTDAALRSKNRPGFMAGKFIDHLLNYMKPVLNVQANFFRQETQLFKRIILIPANQETDS